MEKLKVVENGLVPVYETNTGEKVVYGTELHVVLEAKTKFADWVKRRLKDCDAVENEDFEAISQNWENGGRSIEYVIRLDIAKEMAMLERNAKGKQVRRYFIELEKRYKAAQEIVNRKVTKDQDKFFDVMKEYMFHQSKREQQQEEIIQATVGLVGQMIDGLKGLSAEVESLRSQRIGISSGNPFSVQQDVVDQRMRTLNDLTDQVADLCCMDRKRFCIICIRPCRRIWKLP